MRTFFVFFLSLLLATQLHAGEWITDSNSGCKVWDSDPSPNQSVAYSYSGDCVDGKAHGKGMLTVYFDGKKASHFEGQYKDGKVQHGKGIYTLYKDGKKFKCFEGQFIEEVFIGKGIVTIYQQFPELPET